MLALRLTACNAEFHLKWRRNYPIADLAYASKRTAAELQKGIHSLVQGLSVVKMYFPLFEIFGRGCHWQTMGSVYYLGQQVL
jgi:hypothetical protein